MIILGSDVLWLSIYKALLKGCWSGGGLVLDLLMVVGGQGEVSKAPSHPPNYLIIQDKLCALFATNKAHRNPDHNIQNIFPG